MLRRILDGTYTLRLPMGGVAAGGAAGGVLVANYACGQELSNEET
jgi:hypothetical protein